MLSWKPLSRGLLRAFDAVALDQAEMELAWGWMSERPAYEGFSTSEICPGDDSTWHLQRGTVQALAKTDLSHPGYLFANEVRIVDVFLTERHPWQLCLDR